MKTSPACPSFPNGLLFLFHFKAPLQLSLLRILILLFSQQIYCRRCVLCTAKPKGFFFGLGSRRNSNNMTDCKEPPHRPSEINYAHKKRKESCQAFRLKNNGLRNQHVLSTGCHIPAFFLLVYESLYIHNIMSHCAVNVRYFWTFVYVSCVIFLNVNDVVVCKFKMTDKKENIYQKRQT